MPKKPKAATAAAAPVDDDLESALTVEPSLADKVAVLKGVSEAVALTQRIEKGEELLKTLKSDLNLLQTKTLPALLAQAGTSVFKISEGILKGWSVETQPFIAGSLPKVTSRDKTPEEEADKIARRTRGLQFVRDCGAEDIIKTVMEVIVEKGQDNLLGDLKGKVEELGLSYEVSSDINHKTLATFAKERLKNGETVPFEDLGLHAGTVAKITPPKG